MKSNKGEWLATILAYAIPALQFLYALLGSSTQDVFLFRDQFLVVSVFTGAVSYAFILLVREQPYFSWEPFQKRRKAEWREWNIRTNVVGVIFTDEDVRSYKASNKQPAPIFAITANNITPRILIPLALVSFVIFIALGLLKTLHIVTLGDNWWSLFLILVQAFNYTVLLSVVVVLFAIFYYRNKNQSQYRRLQETLFDRALALARDKNSFGETKAISLLAHREIKRDFLTTLQTFLLTVGDVCYLLIVDANIEKILVVNQYGSVEEGRNDFFRSTNND